MLLGKALDFTSAWLSERAFDPELRVLAIDAEPALIERARTDKKEGLRIGCVAEPRGAAAALVAAAVSGKARDPGWLAEARQALDERPQSWANLVAATPGTLHPAEVFRTLRPYIERTAETVLICDGGEFAQWGQSMLPVRRRLTNSVTGAIGCSLPFALTARLVEPKAPVFAVLGDGTVGFHFAEFETAARRSLPFVAIVGNDARWNAESQIQFRDYGQNRMHGCELLPARYDLAVAALGGHGEFVDRAQDLPQAIERALASGKPACINVMIESTAAPALRRPA
jgi:acetolactate synthase-1/2/3 large subunit